MPTLNESIYKMKEVLLQRHFNVIKDKSYLPLTGKISTQKTAIDLKLLINQFLTEQTKVLLLQGSAGAGKTIFCYQLMKQLLESKESKDVIPFYISLKSEYSKNKNFIESLLQEYSFSSEQITELKQTQKFLFILDDFDQLGCFQNIYLTNPLDEWQAKFIITCRPEYFANTKDYRNYFVPYQKQKALPHLFKEINILPLGESLWLSLKDKSADEFFSSWIAYHKEKYKFSSLFEKELLAYCTEIAHEMQQKKTTKITYRSASRLFDNSRNDWQKYFDPKLTALCMAAPIIKTSENQYEFVRADLAPYFLTKSLEQMNIFFIKLNKLAKEHSNIFSMDNAQQTKKIPDYLLNHYLNQKLFTQDGLRVQFLADRVWEKEIFKNELFKLVFASRKTEQMAKAAANAITILNAAKISFSGMDLCEIQICAADLQRAIFDNTKLCKADLRGVNISGSWLRGAGFTGADMSDIKFGELPPYRLPNQITACCYSTNGYGLVVGSGHEVCFYNILTNNLVSTFEGHKGLVTSVALSADASQIISGSEDKTICLWDMVTKRLLHVFKGHTERITSISLSACGKWFVSGGDDKAIYLWHIEKKELLRTFKGHTGRITSVAFSQDGQKVASASYDNTIRLWDLKNEAPQTLEGYAELFFTVVFSPNNQWLASGSFDNTVQLWDAATNKLFHIFTGHTRWVTAVAFSSNSQLLASASDDKCIRLWDVTSRKLIRVYEGHTSEIISIAFRKDDQWLVSGSGDGTIRTWDLMTQEYRRFLYEKIYPNCIGFNTSGQQLASGGGSLIKLDGDTNGNSIRLWDISTKRLLYTFEGHTQWVTSVSFNSIGTLLASSSQDYTIRLWNVSMRKLLYTFEGHTSWVNSAVFSPSGEMLISASKDKTIRLWNVVTKQLICQFEGHTDSVTSVFFNPTEQLFISGSEDNTIRLWDISEKKLFHIFNGHSNGVNSIAFSPDGQLLASGSWDRTVRLWDVKTKKSLNILRGHKKGINCIAFSPSGQLLASGGHDRLLGIWDVKTGKNLIVVKGFSDFIISIAWCKIISGDYLATASWDKAVRLWKVEKCDKQLHVILEWSNYQAATIATNACLDDVKGLSAANFELLKQLGARGKPLATQQLATAEGKNSEEERTQQSSNDRINAGNQASWIIPAQLLTQQHRSHPIFSQVNSVVNPVEPSLSQQPNFKL